MKISVELFNRAKQAKNVQELMELCRASGLEMSMEEAEYAMSALRTRNKIGMDALMQSAGGTLDGELRCPWCWSTNTWFGMAGFFVITVVNISRPARPLRLRRNTSPIR